MLREKSHTKKVKKQKTEEKSSIDTEVKSDDVGSVKPEVTEPKKKKKKFDALKKKQEKRKEKKLKRKSALSALGEAKSAKLKSTSTNVDEASPSKNAPGSQPVDSSK